MAKIKSLIQKGRNFQTRICDMFKSEFKLTSDDLRTPVGSESGVDIILTSKRAREIIDLSIECKNQKTASLWAWLEQAKSRSGTPALIFHRSVSGNKDIWITVPLKYFIDLKKKAIKNVR
jgi:hypothetical protein